MTSRNNTPHSIPKSILDRVAGFRFEAFNADKDTWKFYFQRFELEISLLQIDSPEYENQRRDLLLRAIGGDMYRTAAEHFEPRSLKDVNYSELTSFLSSHTTKSVSYIIARCEFGQCTRDSAMSVTDFVAKLRSLAPPCIFGSSLDERLRDQFLIGLKNPDMLEKLSELHPSPEDKLDQIVKSALTIEGAQKQRAAFSVLDGHGSIAQQHQISSHQHSNSTKLQRNNRNNQNGANRNLLNNNSSNNNSKGKNNRSNNTRASSNKSVANNSNSVLSLNPTIHCLRCGNKRHEDISTCKATNAKCRACSKIGHYDRACVSSGRAMIQKKASVQYVTNYSSPNDNTSLPNDYDYRHVYNVISTSSDGSYVVSPQVNQIILQMEYDTAADVSLISSDVWKKIGSPELHSPTSKINIQGWGNADIHVLGECNVSVSIGDISCTLPLIVSSKLGASLFGKNWMSSLNLGPLSPKTQEFLTFVPKPSLTINNVTADSDVKKIFEEFNTLFTRQSGTVKNFEAKFELTPDAQPKIFKPRSVPVALKRSVSAEIDRMVKEGYLEPIDVSKTPIEWASPIVVSIKRNGQVRICADFKVTINRFIKKQLHPLPTWSDLFSKFSGFTEFSIIDLKDAYFQMLVHPSCRIYLVIVTEQGYFWFLRLPFGITIAPMVFQRYMDSLLADIEGAIVVQDDIGTGGKNRADHLRRLRLILRRLEDAGFAVQPNKVTLLKTEVVFLGHIIDARGIRPLPSKVKAIKLMPAPTNVSQLRSFLGSVNQFNSFVPNLLPSSHNLHRLLQKNIRWEWSKAEDDTFEHLKTLITSDQILAHFDPSVPVILSCDACEYGIGAVLLHSYPDGRKRMISAASRTLSPAEKNYSVIDREALAIIFGVDKFYKYLYGRHFFLHTDHRPLERIFGEKSEIPKLAASRLVRWAIQLSAFDYTLSYLPGNQNSIADALSRLPIPSISPTPFELEADIAVNQIIVETFDNLSLNSTLLKARTTSDATLQHVIRYLSSSWPNRAEISAELLPYYEKRDVLSFEGGILLFGARVVIPASIRQFVLEKLHYTHPGVNAVKSLARVTVWWPRIDNDIENFVKKCSHCQKFGPKEPQTPLNLWNTPDKPWERIHIDFTGPYQGHLWFVVIDAYSRWLEIFILTRATTDAAINELRSLFLRYGYPNQIVADNGSQFTAADFKKFCSSNSIKLIFSTPYHSRTNGLVERAIRTFKWRYNKMLSDGGGSSKNSYDRLQDMLFVYRTTDHTTTGRTPAELFLGRRLNTVFDLLKPSVRRNITQHQFRTKHTSDQHHHDREFLPNEPVYVRRPIDQAWFPETVATRSTPVSYTLSDGKRVHADHLKKRPTPELDAAPEQEDALSTPSICEQAESTPSVQEDITPVSSISPLRSNTTPARIRHPPKRFHDEFNY